MGCGNRGDKERDIHTDRDWDGQTDRHRNREREIEYYKYVFILVCEIIIMCNNNPHRP